MRYIFYVVLCIVALILQITLLRFLAIQNITPDLLLIIIIFLSIREGQVTGILFGFFAGLLDDLTAAGLIGLSALSKALAGYIAGLFFGIKSGLEIRILGLIVLFSTLSHELIMSIVISFDPERGFWTTLINYGIPRLLYSGLLGFIIFICIPKKTWEAGQPEWFVEG